MCVGTIDKQTLKLIMNFLFQRFLLPLIRWVATHPKVLMIQLFLCCGESSRLSPPGKLFWCFSPLYFWSICWVGLTYTANQCMFWLRLTAEKGSENYSQTEEQRSPYRQSFHQGLLNKTRESTLLTGCLMSPLWIIQLFCLLKPLVWLWLYL